MHIDMFLLKCSPSDDFTTGTRRWSKTVAQPHAIYYQSDHICKIYMNFFQEIFMYILIHDHGWLDSTKVHYLLILLLRD